MESAPFHAEIAYGPDGGKAYWLTAADGLRLRFGHWTVPPAAKGTVFLLPGRTEYVEKYGPAAADFAARGYAMLAVDWRGQGIADRVIDDPLKGHVIAFPDYQIDLAAVIAAAEELGLPKPWFVLGHSMGGAIGLRAVTETGHPFSGVAFSAPMWAIGLPTLLRPFGPLLARILGGTDFAKGYVPGSDEQTYVYKAPFLDNKLTTDPGMWSFMVEQLAGAPDLALAGPTWHWVSEAILECVALAARPSPDLPCFTGVGGRERIIHVPAVHERMARWSKGRLEVFANAQHEIMMEGAATRARFFDDCVATFDAAPR